MFENNPDVVVIAGDLYVKTPQALALVLGEAERIGYRIDDLREADYRKRDNISVETMENNGWSLWFAHLDVRRAKCLSCGKYINTIGVQTHGHTCEYCGAVTYYNIIDGSIILFSFISPDREAMFDDIRMKAHHWDTENGYLYLYLEIKDGLWLKGEKARKYFEANNNLWERVTEGDQELIRVRYPDPFDHEASAISISDISGHYWNYKTVLVWEGKEYAEYFSDFPLPQSFSIFETWHWAPLDSSPTLHKRVLGAIHNHDDKGWHYQDGRPWFSARSFEEMGKFIRHFTTLDAERWDEDSKHFRVDGPGGIDDVAAFCHPEAQVENRPNIGNVLVGLGKAFSGETVTEQEVSAMRDALEDPNERKKAKGLFRRRQ